MVKIFETSVWFNYLDEMSQTNHEHDYDCH